MAIGGGRGTASAPSSPSSSPQLCIPDEEDLDRVPLLSPSLRIRWREKQWFKDFRSQPKTMPPCFWKHLRRVVTSLTSSRVSSCGVAALSSESFCEPGKASMFFLVPSRFFLCLWASFLTWPSALPELSRRTGLVSHFLKVLPGRFGPGELWGPRVWLEPGCRASLLDTDKVSKSRGGEMRNKLYWWVYPKYITNLFRLKPTHNTENCHWSSTDWQIY